MLTPEQAVIALKCLSNCNHTECDNCEMPWLPEGTYSHPARYCANNRKLVEEVKCVFEEIVDQRGVKNAK